MLWSTMLALSRWPHVYDHRGGFCDGPGRDVLGCALSHAGGAAPDAGATPWAYSEYHLHWRHGECPPPVTIYMCQVRRRRPVRGPTGRTWPGRDPRDHRGAWSDAH